MAVLAGKDFLLKSDDGTGTFVTLGGLRSSSMSINNEAIDVTNQGSSQWKELLDATGIRSMSISGSGLFTNSDGEKLAITRMVAGTLASYKISDGHNNYTGTFKITKLERAGDYKGEQTWSMPLESSGAITIT